MKNTKMLAFTKGIICLIIALVTVLAMTSCKSEIDYDEDEEEEEEEEKKPEQQGPAHRHSYMLLDDSSYFVTINYENNKATQVDFYNESDHSHAFSLEFKYNFLRRIKQASMFAYSTDTTEKYALSDDSTIAYDKRGNLIELTIYDFNDEVFSIVQGQNDDGDEGYSLYYQQTYSGFITLNQNDLLSSITTEVYTGYDNYNLNLEYGYDDSDRLSSINMSVNASAYGDSSQTSSVTFSYEDDDCCYNKMIVDSNGTYTFERNNDHKIIGFTKVSDYMTESAKFKYVDDAQLLLYHAYDYSDGDTYSLTQSYSPNNVLIERMETQVFTNWENQVETSHRVESFDEQGNLQRVNDNLVISYEGKTISTNSEVTTYDKNGFVTSTSVIDKSYNSNGDVTYHYEGNEWVDENGYSHHQEFTYLDSYQSYYDSNYGYVWCVEENEYDTNCNITKSTFTYYTNENLETKIRVATYIYSYNSNNYLLYETLEVKSFDENGNVTYHKEEVYDYENNQNFSFTYLETDLVYFYDNYVLCETVNKYDSMTGNIIETTYTYYTNDAAKLKIANSQYIYEYKDGMLYSWAYDYRNDVLIQYVEQIDIIGNGYNTSVYGLVKYFDQTTGVMISEEERFYHDNGNVKSAMIKEYAYDKVVQHTLCEYNSYGWLSETYEFVVAQVDYNGTVVGRIINEYTEGEDPYIFRATIEDFDGQGNVISTSVMLFDEYGYIIG